jgi:hypothetical protein
LRVAKSLITSALVNARVSRVITSLRFSTPLGKNSNLLRSYHRTPPHAGRLFVGKIGEKAGHFSARMKLITAIMSVESRTPHT